MAASSLLARAANAISDKSSLPIRAAAAATVAVGTLFGAHIASGQQLVTTLLPRAWGHGEAASSFGNTEQLTSFPV